MPHLNASCPHFLVADLTRSLDYYVDRLGFTRPPLWGDPPRFAMPNRDGFIVMLNQSDRLAPQPNGNDTWDAYFWCDDAQALYQEFIGRGAIIEHPPVERPLYGMRELAVRDPDGYILAFGSDTTSD